MGVEAFFRRFYVTNISAVGYVKNGRNQTYHDLPEAALRVVERNFMEEMAAVQPARIIALGQHPRATLGKLFSSSTREIDFLPHPSWIMTYRQREADAWVGRYIAALIGE